MPQETEQKSSSKLEDLLNPSEEEEEVSEETEEKPEETPEEKPEDKKTEKDETKELERKIQGEADKRVQSYRDKRESDVAFISSLQTQIKDLKSKQYDKEDSRILRALRDGDEAEELSEEKIKTREKELKAILPRIHEFEDNVKEIEETAQIFSDMFGNLPKAIVSEFGLDDPNPNVKVINGVKLLDEAMANIKHYRDFLLTVEEFVPRGDEVRKQIDDLVNELADYESEKSKRLFLKDRLKGLKITPRKRPPTPSGSGGGTSYEIARQEYIKNPNDPKVRETYLKARKDKGL